MVKGSYFGEEDIILDRKRKYNSICETDCEFYYLSLENFKNVVINEFPHIGHELIIIAEERDIHNKNALRSILGLLKEA